MSGDGFNEYARSLLNEINRSKRLRPAQKQWAIGALNFANRKRFESEGQMVFWVGPSRLAESCGLSRASVHRIRNELIDMGLIRSIDAVRELPAFAFCETWRECLNADLESIGGDVDDDQEDETNQDEPRHMATQEPGAVSHEVSHNETKVSHIARQSQPPAGDTDCLRKVDSLSHKERQESLNQNLIKPLRRADARAKPPPGDRLRDWFQNTKLDPVAWDRWLAKCEIVVVDDTVLIEAPSKFQADWIRERYGPDIGQVLGVRWVEIEVRRVPTASEGRLAA